MNAFDKQLNALEMRLTRRPDVKTAVALTLRCWWVYKNAGALSFDADARAYLHKAQHTAQAALRKNETHMQLFMTAIFISIEAERYDNANEMLDKAMGFRAFLKTSEPLYYAVLRFLYAYLEIKQKRARSARKHIHALQEFITAAAYHPLYDVMQGWLSLSFYEYAKAYASLAAAYDNGCRSVFLLQALHTYYRTSVKAPCGPTLLPTLCWAAAHRTDVADIINVYPDELRDAILKHPAAGDALYANAPHPFVLREVCAGRMMAADFGPQAYELYREAERRQVYLNGLYTFLVKAARANRHERVNHYAMTEFLRQAERQAQPMEEGLAVYVYHLLLTDPALTDLVPERKNIILQLAAQCLENDAQGREANSLYGYYWAQCGVMGVGGALPEKAEALLAADLTRYAVDTPPDAACLYVTEPERKGMTVYDCTGETTYIHAVGEDIHITCLGAGRKGILSQRPAARRMVNQAGFTLYRHFYHQGARGFYLLAYLANHFLAWLDEAGDSPDADTSGEAAAVFTALLTDGHCAKPYRMRLLAALGGLHYAAGRFGEALAQYGAVDENELDDKYLGQVLQVYLRTHEWARAVGLVTRRGARMARQTLFDAVHALRETAAAHRKELAQVAYTLLTEGCYSPELLDLTLGYFNGSLEEWRALSHALDALQVSEPRLDELIIKNSLWGGHWNEDAQRAYARLSGGAFGGAPLLARFAAFAAYEMLVNNTRPEYDTLTLLEDAYMKNASPVLAYALCHVYLRHHVTTFRSERVLRDAAALQEAAGILFPVFHERRAPAPVLSPYVEKHQPFMYRGLPDKDVYLYYRVDDGKAFSAKRMTYVCFGVYLAALPLFYNERLTYYFSEEMPTGSITTKDAQVKNSTVYLHEEDTDDVFFVINNALIYEQMFKHEQVEKIITGLVKEVRPVRSGLM